MDETIHESDESSENLVDQAPKDELQELPIKDFSYVNNQPVTPPSKSPKKGLIIALIVILVLIAGGALAYILSSSKPKTDQATKTTTTTKQTTSSKAPSIPLTSYSSSNFNLTVSYPKTWSVSSDTSSALLITSPVMDIVNAEGQTVKGKAVVSVQPEGSTPTNFGTSNATAVLASQLMTYSNPTANQRAKTYVTFAQYAATTTLGGLDGIYLTGNNGYTKGQDIPLTDLKSLNPLVSVSFEACKTDSCTSVSSMTVSSNDWKNLDFQTPIMDVLKSFAFS